MFTKASMFMHKYTNAVEHLINLNLLTFKNIYRHILNKYCVHYSRSTKKTRYDIYALVCVCVCMCVATV